MTAFTLPGPALATAAAWAGRLIPSRPITPQLGGVLIRAAESEITVTAYDMDTVGTATLPAKVDAPGEVLVSGALLSAVTRTLGPRDEATLTVHDAVAELSVRPGTGWELPTLERSLYPELPTLPPAVAEIDAEALSAGLARVLPFASSPDAAKFHGAVALSGEGDLLTIATTDSHRLGVIVIPAQLPAPVAEVLAPAEVLRAALTAAKAAGTVSLRLDENGVGLAGAHYTVTGRALSVEMPWQKIDLTPEQVSETRVLIDTGELRTALERTTAVLDAEEPITVTFDEEITVAPTAGKRAKARHTCEPVSHDGPAQTLGVNADFLRDALDAAGPYALLGFAARAWHPISLRGCDGDGTPGPFRASLAQKRLPAAKAAA